MSDGQQMWDDALAIAEGILARPYLEKKALKILANLEPRLVELLESIDQSYTVADLLKMIRE